MKEKNILIDESHKRSRIYGVNKRASSYKRVENGQALNKILRDKELILNVAIPYIKTMYESMENHDFIIILTDENGCILYINGDGDLLVEFGNMNIVIGAYMDEESIGTNAMGTAIKEDRAIQVTASEHYIEEFGKLTCIASPIHDKRGKIIGTLNLTGWKEKRDSKDIDFVVFGAKVIEMAMKNNEIKDKTIMQEINASYRNCDTSYEFDDIIGQSSSIKKLIAKCKSVSNSPSTVLIEGESGTGKEMIAQSIHNYSYRKGKNFIAINCGAIPLSIMESELFGYEEGSFTGGKKGGRMGKIEMANGGTLFLDEVGEMPMDMQVKMLRVLQEGRIMRVGGYKEIPIDIRVIAATNRNLKEEVKNGTFREDLYYRLCVIPIRVPSLRERKEDIKELIEYFLNVKSMKIKKDVRHMSYDILNKLINYQWPGNIRELENTIESYVNLEEEFVLNEYNTTLEDKTVAGMKEEEYTITIEEMERRLIVKNLKFYGNNITKTAESLGISRNTLYLKMKKHGIKVS